VSRRSITRAVCAAGAAAFALSGGAPMAAADAPAGNYQLSIPARYDFHTWVWAVAACPIGSPPYPDCILVSAIARPIAKAFEFTETALRTDGRYTLTVDDPLGLRCGDVYYGPTSPTHDVYTWNADTMTGTLVSSFDAGCDGRPGTLSYDFALTHL
jgi:hypothetical protein